MCCEKCIALAAICDDCLERGIWMFMSEGEEPQTTRLVDVVPVPHQWGDGYDQGLAVNKFIARNMRVIEHTKRVESLGLQDGNPDVDPEGGYAADFGTPLTGDEALNTWIYLIDEWQTMLRKKHKYRNVQMGTY